MSKKWIAGILLMVMIFVVTGCSTEPSFLDNLHTQNGTQTVPDNSSDEMITLDLGCSGDYGYYVVRGSLIHFFDYASNQRIVLCNKPNCTHTDTGCNGFVAAADSNPASQTMVASSAKFVFYQSNALYLFCSDGRVLSMKFDGTEHRQLNTIDGKYELNSAYRKGNTIYIQAFYSEEENKTIVEKSCFLLYDITANEWKQTKAYERNADTLLGVWAGCAFYYHKSELSQGAGLSFEESVRREDANPCVVYKIQLETGEKNILCEKTEGELCPASMINGNLYFHSRAQEAICSLDIETAEISVLTEGVTGKVLFDKAFDGHLVFRRTKKITANTTAADDVIETFDPKTGKVDEAYRLKTNIGWNDGFRGVLAVTPDSYVLIYKADFVVENNPEYAEPSVVDMTPYVGIIKKSDFWSKNYTFTEIPWF